MVKSLNEVLNEARNILKENDIDEREARLLLAFSLGLPIEKLIIKKECTVREYQKYIKIINMRASKIPYAYIVGHKEFMKLNFKVDQNVLIPREDTEVLINEVIRRVRALHNLDSIRILDMCTGSGCIAISLAKYINGSKVTAVDISEKALKIARFNANENNVEVSFINSNLFEVLSKDEKFDIIVSNPPYIKKAVIDELQEEVKKEPKIALDGGVSGLEFYEKIVNQASYYLNDRGILAFEIGYDQGKEVSELMKKNGYKNVIIIKDLSENDRVVIGYLIS